MVVLLLVAVAWRSPWRAALADPAAQAGSDFQILLAAGLAQTRGLDAHDPAVLDAVGRELGRANTPFCAAPPLVVAAFGRLGDDLQTAWSRWLTLHAACGLIAALALARLASQGGRSPLAALAVGLGLLGLGDGLWMSLAMNSTNLVALAALSLALLAAVRERPLAEGLLLAVAVLAKTSPALVIVAALLAGRRRTVVAALAGLLGLTLAGVALVGWDVHVSWWQRVLPALGYAPLLPPGHFDNGLHQWNLAPHGLIARAALGAELPRALVLACTGLVSGLVLLQLGLACRRARPAQAPGAGPDEPGASTDLAPAAPGAAVAQLVRARSREYGLAVGASLLVSSVTWPHHLVLAALPGLALLLHVARPPRCASSSASLPASRPALLVGCLALVLLAQPLGTWGAEGAQPPDVLVYAAACVLLFMALAALPRSGPASAPTSRP